MKNILIALALILAGCLMDTSTPAPAPQAELSSSGTDTIPLSQDPGTSFDPGTSSITYPSSSAAVAFDWHDFTLPPASQWVSKANPSTPLRVVTDVPGGGVAFQIRAGIIPAGEFDTWYTLFPNPVDMSSLVSATVSDTSWAGYAGVFLMLDPSGNLTYRLNPENDSWDDSTFVNGYENTAYNLSVGLGSSSARPYNLSRVYGVLLVPGYKNAMEGTFQNVTINAIKLQ